MNVNDTNNMKPFELSKQQQMPDIMLSGSTVDRLLAHLRDSVIFAKGIDGAMHPYIDPIPVISVLIEAAQIEIQRRGLVDNAQNIQSITIPKPN